MAKRKCGKKKGDLKVVFTAAEMHPFGKVGGLGDVISSLPPELEKLGLDVKVIIPYYTKVYKGEAGEPKHIADLRVKLGTKEYQVDLYSATWKGIEVWLLRNDEMFGRDGIYLDPSGVAYEDEYLRFALLSMGALASLKEMNFKPDVILANDWHTAYIPIYLKNNLYGFEEEGFLSGTKVAIVIHNIAYQGQFPKDILGEVGIPESLYTIDALEFYGKVNILKGGIVFSDLIITVSPTYAKEIQESPEYGMGLEGILRARSSKVVGILNGIDYDYWNPSKDEELYFNYNLRNVFKGKLANKEKLQEELGLPTDPEIPLLGVVARLAEQKGFDLLADAIRELKDRYKFQLVILGTGKPEIQEELKLLENELPDKVKVNIAFDPVLAKRIYASSDLFLMPSRFEPCGLGQMIAYRYGTIPVARRTGGLKDTIVDYTENPSEGTGFLFDDPTPVALSEAISRGLDLYYGDRKAWRGLVKRVMKLDYSWKRSAERYAEVLRDLVREKV